MAVKDGPRTSRAIGVCVTTVILLMMSIPPSTLASSGGDGEGGSDVEGWAVSKHKSVLPMAVYRASAVWTGEKAYIFSGRVEEGPVDTIIEFDPAKGTFAIKVARFPKAIEMATAAWYPPYAFIFGGGNYSEVLDEVARYDPVKDSLIVLPYRMPGVTKGASAFTIGDAIYIIGGRTVEDHVDTVFKFYPDKGTFEVLDPFPIATGGRAAVVADGIGYLFGGGGSKPNETAFRFDPTTGTARKLDVDMEYGYYWATGVWTGDSALICGGNDFKSTIDPVLEFRPGSGGLGGDVRKVAKLPKPIELATSVYDNGTGKAYIFGGRSTEKASDAVYVLKRTSKKDDVEVTPLRAIAVVGLMAFVVLVVIIQNYRTGGGGRKEDKLDGARAKKEDDAGVKEPPPSNK